jgi:cytochrome c oxidase cbb3-type subunit 2
VLEAPVEVRAGEKTTADLTYRRAEPIGETRALPPLDFSAPATAVAKRSDDEDASIAREAERFAAAEERTRAELAIRRAARTADVAAGRALYGRYCAACHGDAGDGRGEAAASLRTLPRDFTRGEFKFRSTRSGQLPTEDDLFRTITAGLPGSDMPAWRAILSAGDRRVLARYVMSFSDRFLYAPEEEPLAIPPETPNDDASRARGRELYARLQCAQCHGGDGRGAVSEEMIDDWGRPIEAPDLRRGLHKSGPKPADRYRALSTGLSGSPMPSFVDQIGPAEMWDLVHYVDSLAKKSAVRSIIGLP